MPAYGNAPTYDQPEPVVKHHFDESTHEWSSTEVWVQLSKQAFQSGTMRLVYHLKDLSMEPGKQDFVAKVFRDPTEERQLCFDEAEMQVKCKELAQQFNQLQVPKHIDFVLPDIMEFKHRPSRLGTGCFCVTVEPYLKGRYVKHSNNYGFVSPEDRNTPQAFSHWTYCHSKGKLLVCDIQGVGDLFTDPQIHSNDGPGIFRFGRGDMGIDGIMRFFATHRCNSICEFLQLPTGMNKKSETEGTAVNPKRLEASDVLSSPARQNQPPPAALRRLLPVPEPAPVLSPINSPSKPAVTASPHPLVSAGPASPPAAPRAVPLTGNWATPLSPPTGNAYARSLTTPAISSLTPFGNLGNQPAYFGTPFGSTPLASASPFGAYTSSWGSSSTPFFGGRAYF
eukprot:TRINITY_DN1478_c0_g1_i1.p1 TRINITY_DN1478_c0_g1~~TRINITY_DN1478_c0_g1_i1.p1  ORF type:complete len:410 (-),score=59.85 TRINITY_DN1478_c0_g1_i1:224-1408(-)